MKIGFCGIVCEKYLLMGENISLFSYGKKLKKDRIL
jgi:hypothetical protein